MPVARKTATISLQFAKDYLDDLVKLKIFAACELLFKNTKTFFAIAYKL